MFLIILEASEAERSVLLAGVPVRHHCLAPLSERDFNKNIAHITSFYLDHLKVVYNFMF